MRWKKRLLRVAVVAPIVASSALVMQGVQAQTGPTPKDIALLAKQACPNNWQAPLATVDFDPDQDIWVNNIGDKGHFVLYANDYLKGSDGTLTVQSFNDPEPIIYECGDLKVAFYKAAKQAALGLMSNIDSQTGDADQDGVADGIDACPNTATGESVTIQGCSDALLDADADGVSNMVDLCPSTAPGDQVDTNGCALRFKDTDGDGINDLIDQCPATAINDTPNNEGCAPEQIDSDGDDIPDYRDPYPRQTSNCTP